MKHSFTTIARIGTGLILGGLLLIAMASIAFTQKIRSRIKEDLQDRTEAMGIISEVIYEFSKTSYTFRVACLESSTDIKPCLDHLEAIEQSLARLKVLQRDDPEIHEQLEYNAKKCKTLIYAYQATYFDDPSRDYARESLETISSVLEESKEKSIRYCRLSQIRLKGTIEQMLEELQKAQSAMIATLFLAEFVVIGVIIGIYKTLKHYLKGIVEAADAIREGNLSHRIDKPHGDMVGQVASRINMMAQRIQASEEKLQRSNDQLIEALAQARKADVLKSEFLANMSHEIRTPMSAILGFGEVLSEEQQLTQKQNEYVQMILNNGKMLLQLINDILDFSKIEAGKLSVETIEFSLSDFLEDVLSTLHPMAAAKGLQFEILQCSELPAVLRSDPVRIRQCLVNLVGNAIKFTEAGHVFVNLVHQREDDTDYIRFDVEDTGIGIPPDRQEDIFNAFTQVDGSHTRKFGGTGLGLSITRRLIELLGGRISLKSTVGSGTVFSMWIPAGVKVDEQPSINRYQMVESALAEPAKAEPEQLTGRILIVEDAKANQELIRLLLQKMGLETVVVENGQKAVDAVLGQPFDLVLMDMQMPVMNGYEATRAIRAKGLTLPIVALTAHAMKGDEEKCLEAGCDSYLTKPINRKALMKILTRYLADPAKTRA